MIIKNTDIKLIEELILGSSMAFEVIYKRYFKDLVIFASQFVGYEEAESIVQETMIWLWENKSEINPKLSLKSLLYTIVKNKSLNCITHYKVRRKVFEELVSTTDINYNYHEEYSDKGLFIQYKQLLDNMPKKFKEPFILNRSNKLTHKQIANKLKVSPQTVNYRISQALKYLRKGLSDFLIISIIISLLIS